MNDRVMSIANKVAGQLPREAGKTLALGTVVAIGEILVEVFKACQQWKTQPTRALAAARSPNLIQRVRLRRAVYHRIKDPQERSQALDALLASRHDATVDDIKTLLDAAGEDHGSE